MNCHHRNDPSSPWGGFGQSGIGRENGPEAFEEYTTTKSLTIRTFGLLGEYLQAMYRKCIATGRDTHVRENRYLIYLESDMYNRMRSYNISSMYMNARCSCVCNC